MTTTMRRPSSAPQPTTEAEWKEVASGFSDKWNFLHCCGAISLVHVRNLHPGANLYPGCIFGHVNGWNLHPVQICTRVQIVHMNAKCIISIHFDCRFRTMAGIFNYDVV